MKPLNEYDVTELSPIELKEYNGGITWWVAGIICYVVAEIIEGVDEAIQRGCLKPQ